MFSTTPMQFILRYPVLLSAFFSTSSVTLQSCYQHAVSGEVFLCTCSLLEDKRVLIINVGNHMLKSIVLDSTALPFYVKRLGLRTSLIVPVSMQDLPNSMFTMMNDIMNLGSPKHDAVSPKCPTSFYKEHCSST